MFNIEANAMIMIQFAKHAYGCRYGATGYADVDGAYDVVAKIVNNGAPYGALISVVLYVANASRTAEIMHERGELALSRAIQYSARDMQVYLIDQVVADVWKVEAPPLPVGESESEEASL